MRWLAWFYFLVFLTSMTLLVTSLWAYGSIRDDRFGMVELTPGRVKVCTRDGLIGGSAIDPSDPNPLLFTDSEARRWEWRDEQCPDWQDLLTDTSTDGEDSSCSVHPMPLGAPVAISAYLLVSVVCALAIRWRARAVLVGFCLCGYTRQGLAMKAVCPECGVQPA